MTAGQGRGRLQTEWRVRCAAEVCFAEVSVWSASPTGAALEAADHGWQCTTETHTWYCPNCKTRHIPG